MHQFADTHETALRLLVSVSGDAATEATFHVVAAKPAVGWTRTTPPIRTKAAVAVAQTRLTALTTGS
jgi:hypothetical protein